jgi:hypothetical protein
MCVKILRAMKTLSSPYKSEGWVVQDRHRKGAERGSWQGHMKDRIEPLICPAAGTKSNHFTGGFWWAFVSIDLPF